MGHVLPEIYLSCAHGIESKTIAEELEQKFAAKNIVIKSRKNARYRESLSQFIQQLGQGKFIILIICKKYLAEAECMSELLEINKQKQFRDRIFPIVIKNVEIDNPIKLISYSNFWDNQIKALNNGLLEIDGFQNIDGIITKHLNHYQAVRTHIIGLLNILSDMNNLGGDFHQEDNYNTIFEAIIAQASKENDALIANDPRLKLTNAPKEQDRIFFIYNKNKTDTYEEIAYKLKASYKESDKEVHYNGVWEFGDNFDEYAVQKEIESASYIALIVNGTIFQKTLDKIKLEWLEDKSLLFIKHSGDWKAIKTILLEGGLKVKHLLPSYDKDDPLTLDDFKNSDFGYKLLNNSIKSAIKEIKGNLPVAENHFEEHLLQFDFSKQKEAFSIMYKAEKPFNLVYVCGSSQCGQNLLIKHLLQRFDQLNKSGIVKETFIFSAAEAENIKSISVLWKRLATSFKCSSSKPADVCQAILNCTQEANMGLLFDNINAESEKDILEFWVTLSDQIPVGYQGKKLFLFCIQRNFNTENGLNLQFEHPLSQIINLPPIEKITSTDIEDWVNDACPNQIKPQLEEKILPPEVINNLSNDRPVKSVVYTICCSQFDFKEEFYYNLFDIPKS